jgi:hypothetical protein
MNIGTKLAEKVSEQPEGNQKYEALTEEPSGKTAVAEEKVDPSTQFIQDIPDHVHIPQKQTSSSPQDTPDQHLP